MKKQEAHGFSRCEYHKSYTLSQTLLDILACPACKGKIEHVEAEQKLVCQGECQRRYPIRDGIPVMLIDEAELPSK